MPTVDTTHGLIFYAETNGSERANFPLVLVHGAGSSHLCWPAEMRRIPGYRVIAPDLPGHGRSSGTGYNQVEKYATAVQALLDQLEIDRAYLAGHSMGSAIVQTMAVTLPERVAGLILIGAGAHLPVNEYILNNTLADQRGIAEKITRWSWASDAPDRLKQLSLQEMLDIPAEVLHGDYVACSTFDLREKIHEIAAPVLMIGGTIDKMTPLDMGKTLVENIQHAELVIIEGGGHYMMLEQPAVVGNAVEGWLGRQVGARHESGTGETQ